MKDDSSRPPKAGPRRLSAAHRDGSSRPAPPLAEHPAQERILLVETYLRSLALQASWNSQRLQNLGLLVTLLPGLRRLSLSRFDRRRFFRRHFEYFNTNPYLANSLLGGLLRLESDHTTGQVPLSLIMTFKNTLARSVASLGDQLFWLGLKPALVLIMVILVMSGKPLAVAGLLVVILGGQLVLRWQALMAGFRLGIDIVDWLARPFWRQAIENAKRLGMLATGVMAGLYVANLLGEGTTRNDWTLLGAVALSAGLPLIIRHRLGGESALFLALPLALALVAI